jgi:hypothetical protein
MTLLGDSVGANGCSPEGEALSQAQGRRQKGASLLRRPIFFICDPIQNHILLVGANGCSPEGEALSQAQSRRQKVVGLLTQASHIRQGCPSKDPLVACQETLNAWKSKDIKNKVNRQRSTVLRVDDRV